MKTLHTLICLFLSCGAASAINRYVDINSTNPTPPYMSWATATRDIQVAVDASANGDTILVADGHYSPPSSAYKVSKAVKIKGVHGPEATVVDGEGLHRCFYLTGYCVISGFTITNGYSGKDGAGVYCTGDDPLISNCVVSGNTAVEYGGGMYQGKARNCTFRGNMAYHGGGMYSTTAENCIIRNNEATYGGGTSSGDASNCTIIGNTAYYGGGTSLTHLRNCIVWYNRASGSPEIYGSSSGVQYTCSPDVTHGVTGNITNAPLLVSSSHLAADSPCRGAGSAAYTTGTDIDGETWLDPPSMGCDEFNGSVAGSLCVHVDFIDGMPLRGDPVRLMGDIDGAASMHVWDFGDGTGATNNLVPLHAWENQGTYDVVLTAYNDDFPGGVSTTQAVHVIDFEASAVYVSTIGNDANDGSSWATAKATIQAGIDAQEYVGGLVLVGSGTYALTNEISMERPMTIKSADGPKTTIVDGQGSHRCFYIMGNSVVISGFTITNGYASYGAGAYMRWPATNNVITNCIIVGNHAEGHGGGVHDCTVINCIIRGNRASSGGGQYHGVANNCAIFDNKAEFYGGGMFGGVANNCTIVGNTAVHYGGGMSDGIAQNCIVWFNQALAGPDLYTYRAPYNENGLYPVPDQIVRNTCSPDVVHGVDGNITNAPLLASSSHLAQNSPCLGVGSPLYVSGTDIDGEAWMVPPSMGCDELHGSVGGPLQLDMESSLTNPVNGYAVRLLANIEGAASMHVWDFGDGTSATNNLNPVHAWDNPGTYDVVVTVYNADHPNGISATQTIHIIDREATTVYVSTAGNDANDGSSWATAKATIQAGVDAQDYPGGVVLVGNGTYALTNEILVDKPIVIESMDGAGNTIVDGQGSTRCFYLTDVDCTVRGFTIANGYAGTSAGGVYCVTVNPELVNCVIRNNTRYGIQRGTVNNCVIRDNETAGITSSMANSCMIRDNRGSGASWSVVNNSIIRGNTTDYDGGGIYGSTANNCLIYDNYAGNDGGGIYESVANNCTIVGNTALGRGGGVGGLILEFDWWEHYVSDINNCIVWYNHANTANDIYIHKPVMAPPYGITHRPTVIARNTCSPDVLHGVDGNITNAPLLLSASHIAYNSPCRGVGDAFYATGTDIDGEGWLDPPSMGCDEYRAPLDGLLEVDMQCSSTNPVNGYPVRLGADINGEISMHEWSFGDGTGATNAIYLEHAWSVPGTYNVVLTAYNDDYPEGISTTQTIHVADWDAVVIHIAPTGNDTNNGAGWATAKATIQAGVDAQIYAGGLILVSNGIYAVTNAIQIAKSVVVESMNGPEGTIVDGQGVSRCFFLGGVDCSISGLTITNGSVSFPELGAGVYCDTTEPQISNCIISGNISRGGIYRGTLYHSLITGNTGSVGFGAVQSIANYCIVTDNSRDGMRGGVANYCTISNNMSYGIYEGTANYCVIAGNASGGISRGEANNSLIIGNGGSLYGGGGAYASTLNNCIISGNTAATCGGGIYTPYSGEPTSSQWRYSSASNCLIYNNTAARGAGAYGYDLNHCTIVNNTATEYGGGTALTETTNSIIWYNNAPVGVNIYTNDFITYSCSPDAVHGVDGNITNAPGFVDPDGGDYRLLATSPCIDAGLNDIMSGSLDLDGMPRVIDGDFDGVATVDMGAYEYQVMLMSATAIHVPSINLKSNGRCPVKILGSESFDVSVFDPASVRFAGAWPVTYRLGDQNGDGIADLMLHFMTSALEIEPGDTTAMLIGQTYDGTLVVATPSIKVVPGKGR